MAKFPEIEGGGSLMLAWQIRNKLVLMVGGGEVSHIRRIIYPGC
jgi:precorrin-2 dehydrogenase/sirohydrochlorin ferrochelatase